MPENIVAPQMNDSIIDTPPEFIQPQDLRKPAHITRSECSVVELPAPEPVGMELRTPKSGTVEPPEEWPLPLSPLPLLFAMAELRDERTRWNESPRHETYYNL
jgi:hypothetical protein